MFDFEIWSDNENEADWFVSLDTRLSEAKIRKIAARGQNPTYIESLVVYDRPDVVLVINGKPSLVLEKTQEVPTGHNVGQRFARLARAVEHTVPVLYFLPFDARKHGVYSSMCNLNARLLRALQNISSIHSSPAVAVNWPCDSSGNLIWDGRENERVSKLVSELLDSGHPGVSWQAQLKLQEDEWKRRTTIRPEYAAFPNSVAKYRTSELEDYFKGDFSRCSPKILSRSDSVVYTMDMSPEKCRRQDPYTGMQFIYDYGWLRTGRTPADRHSNFFLSVPQVDLETWTRLNPNDPTTKSCNWYLVADGIFLKDDFILMNSWPHL